jgi:hypothetical protein
VTERIDLAEELVAIAMAKALREAIPCLSGLWGENADPEIRAYHYGRMGVPFVPSSAWARCDAKALRYARIYHGLFVGFEDA